MLRAAKRLNRAALLHALVRPRRVYAGVALLFGLAAWGATQLPRAFLPAFNEGTVLVGISFVPGISLAESARLGAVAERLLADLPTALAQSKAPLGGDLPATATPPPADVPVGVAPGRAGVPVAADGTPRPGL